MTPCASQVVNEIRAVRSSDSHDLAMLHAVVFGPGRFARTAYRVREGAPSVSTFCRVAQLNLNLVAAVTFTRVTIGARSGAILLGPLAVAPNYTGLGLGRKVVASGLEAARDCGVVLAVLVGDIEYYGRMGFERAPPGQIIFPGPVDPLRLLVSELVPDSLSRFRGPISAEYRRQCDPEPCDLVAARDNRRPEVFGQN
jgi:predicted N-acetyltransferase YhbS